MRRLYKVGELDSVVDYTVKNDCAFSETTRDRELHYMVLLKEYYGLK